MFKQSARRLTTKASNGILKGKTIGEMNKELQTSSGPFVENLIKSESYKSFFADFEDKQIDGKSRITSFEEQKSFNQVLDFLTQDKNRVGIVNSLKEEIGLDSNSISTKGRNMGFNFSFFSKKSHPVNLEMRFEQKQVLNKKVLDALLPTIEHINENINNSNEMYLFTKNEVIESFVKSIDDVKSLKYNGDEQERLIEQIASTSLKSPEEPLINILTLPVLLRCCFKSLIVDFNDTTRCRELVNYIKQHPLIELYGYGMNIDVYNELLIQTWSTTKNLNLIAQLIDEIKANAIKHDLLTYKIISLVYLKCFRVKDGIISEPYILWSNRSDIYKIKAYLDSIVVL